MKPKSPTVPTWEWLVAGAGLILILFVLGALIWEAVLSSGTPPMIELRVKKSVPQGSGELVMIEVHNRGGQVASDLKVRGSLGKRGMVLESREITIDYVPRNSRRVIGLFFSQPTRDHNLRLEPVGFVKP